MHELSIAIRIVDAAAESARLHDGQTLAVHLKLGTLSGVVKEALLSAWEFARLNSLLEAAELVVQEVPATAYCPVCECERELVSLQSFRCVHCESPVGQVIQGRELEVVALEMSE